MKSLTQTKWKQRIVILSLLLLFFNIPHTLEDFALGAPAEAGIPVAQLATVVSLIFFLQALGLYWLGQNKKGGLYIHVFLSLFWPIASGIAQLPEIFNSAVYRSGMLSKAYVFGMIIVGLLMLFSTIMTFRAAADKE